MNAAMHTYEAPMLLIGGAWRAATSGCIRDVLNPANQEVIGSLGLASPDDLAEALRATEQGFNAWSAVPAQTLARAAASDLKRVTELG
jgi:acyl-CoA reductase-like NAD-dependent aldehyde dehydrogenase